MLDAIEEAFDAVALFVEVGVEGAPGCSADAVWDDGDSAACADGISGSLSIIGFVGHNEARLQALEQGFDLSDVVAFAARQ